MSIRNLKEDLNKLRELLPQLRSGNIHAIEFGDPDVPMGFMSHHRIKLIATPGGTQFCFKLISRCMEGSGDYIGNPTDREIEIRAQTYLERYFKPTPFSAHLAKFQKKPSDKLMYFAVKDE